MTHLNSFIQPLLHIPKRYLRLKSFMPPPSPHKRRVLRLISRLNVGGPAHHVLLLSRSLPAEKYETLLVAGQEPAGELRAQNWIEKYGVPVLYIPTLEREPSFWKDLRSLWWLWRLMRRWKPHIVHTHTAKAGAIGRLAAWLACVPVRIHTFHGHSLEGYFSPLVSYLYRLVEKGLARLSHQIIAISERQKEDLVQRFHIAPAEKVRVIPLGFDLARLDEYDPQAVSALRQEWQKGEVGPLIAWIGRAVPIKRVDRLIEAAVALQSQGVAFRLIFVGDGPERPKWEALSNSLGLNAIWAGLRWDIPVVLRAVDAVVLTSDNEGTPVTLIEALACGTPVASTPVGGVPDLLEGGRWGTLLTEPLTESLKQFIQNLPEARKQAQTAAPFIRQRYSQERLLKDIEDLYDALCRRC
ncbi:MAG: glycosyltransferase [Bacteroidia bacterium]|nr:glycosyltransferase [Bacteroidia bacterium]MCX7763429.1 glycosyltransferase [Bacteroidia bacterium]MDW8057594.1 glycosyltransferase [Bacteroidia bacterium]